MPRLKSPPPVNLDKYLDRSKHRYMSYEDGARLMGIPYWGFVRMAKEADATWALRKTAMVDMNVVEKYIEENCIDLSSLAEEGQSMKQRKMMNVNTMDELIKGGKKKYVRYAEGAELYSVGRHTFEKLAKDAGAVRKVNGVVLVNTEKLDAFIESFCEEEY